MNDNKVKAGLQSSARVPQLLLFLMSLIIAYIYAIKEQ
jgi:hypothetical protein